MVIDIHTHAWPEKVSQQARKNLESLFKASFVGDPTPQTLLSFMEKNGIDVSVVCAVATKPEQVPSINRWLFGIRERRIRVFCSLHPDYPEWEKELTAVKEKGDGIKLQPEFQNFYADEERMYPLYERMQRLGLPVLFHCGEELSGTMLVRSSPQRIIKVKRAFPELTIIAAHFGGFRLWDEVKEHLLGTDVYLDTSFFFPFVSREQARSLILAHRPDRLLFGTDFPLVDQGQDLAFIRGLDLGAELTERILSRNAREIIGV